MKNTDASIPAVKVIKHKKWTAEEISILRESLQYENPVERAKGQLSRTELAIKIRLRQFGFRQPPAWTPEMLNILKERYPKEGASISLRHDLKAGLSKIRKKVAELGIQVMSRAGPLGASSVVYSGYKEITGTYWNIIKKGARYRGHLFTVSKEFLWDLFIAQGRRCALSGLIIEFEKCSRCERTASLDRIDSSKGYIEGNVQWLHKDINLMKNYFNTDKFVRYCSMIHANTQSK